MGKFKFSLAIIALIFLLPNSSGEVSITANGESRILFVDSGEKVTFTAKGIENTTSILWDFGIDINGPNTRYSNLTSVSHMIYAEGRYDIIFTAFYEDKNYSINEYTLFVDYEEKDSVDVINNEALFFAVAGTELIMSAVLGYWTQQIRKEKIYLWRLLIATIDAIITDAKIDTDGKPVSSSEGVSRDSLFASSPSSVPT